MTGIQIVFKINNCLNEEVNELNLQDILYITW